MHAQATPGAGETLAGTGGVGGVLKDPSGAVIAGAKVELGSSVSEFSKSLRTDPQGLFVFDSLPAGHYRLTVTASGFASAMIRDLVVRAGSVETANLTLKVEPMREYVEVDDQSAGSIAATSRQVDATEQGASRNIAEMVAEAPGVSLRANGQLASIPMLHGLGDERTKTVVDGMTIANSCPNHMNPPLSYVAPAQALQVTVIAGITPVSLGGDSLGGTVSIESRLPVFAEPGGHLHEEGSSTGFYRSNGDNFGGSLTEWVASSNLGIGYTGYWTTNDDYTDGAGHKVTSTYAQSTDHTMTLAAQGAGNLVVLQVSLHHTPYEGFVGARMDMVRNYAESLNLRYRRGIGAGTLDAHVFWQDTFHSMNIGHDKSTFPMPMSMPMNTHGKDLGYTLRYELPFSARHILRIGNELHRFVLDDTWPAVPGMAPMMGPNTFVDINDGRRIRLGTYLEVVSKWTPQWSTLLGVRNDTIWTNAGAVQGYSSMYSMDANAFNAANRAHTDPDIDVTAVARYEPSASGKYEFGCARKSRAPNLYERYAWSTNWMASGMIGWFDDGNYYVGNLGLKPEVANTVSGTADWRGHASRAWELKATPYLTYVEDYIDVNTLATTMYGMSTFAQLQFANHNARLYGGDLSGNVVLWQSDGAGRGTLSGVAGWVHGSRLDTGSGLYQMMPLNARLALEEERKDFTAGVGAQAVDRKSRLDPNRFEQATPGYALFDVHAGFRRGFLQANASVENLFNRDCDLPLGGVNLDDFMASMQMNQIKPLTGRGRSVLLNVTANF
jgi:iron complex outermembrane receptor protein